MDRAGSTIGNRRRAMGWSQYQLAVKSGLTPSAIQKLEQGVNSLEGAQAITVYRLAQALEMTVEALLTGENPLEISPLNQ